MRNSLPLNPPAGREQERPWKWESEVAGLIARAPARAHPVVCIGSSSFTIWFTLNADLGDIGALNHGFGGAELSDCNYYWDRLVVPYSPRVVVLAAGDNDLANGKSTATVIADFEHAVRRTRTALPAAKLLFLAVKPSVARWPLFAAQSIVNGHVAARAKEDRQIGFVDIRPAMLADDGHPIPALYLEDGLHLSTAGYAAWAGVLRPRLHLELANSGS